MARRRGRGADGPCQGRLRQAGPRDRHRDDDVRTRPDALRGARGDAQRHSVPLDKTHCEGDPIDMATGEMILAQTDLDLPGVLPLNLRRVRLSRYRYGQWFGRSWASTLNERLEADGAGLLPFAYIEGTGAHLYWLTGKDVRPEDRTVLANAGRGPEWEYHPVAGVRFILSVLTGEIHSDVLDNLPVDDHAFDPNDEILGG